MRVIVLGEKRIAPDYSERLALFRRRRRDQTLTMLLLTGLFPLGLWFGPRIGLPVWAVLALTWFFLGFAWFRIDVCRCPRCEERYFKSGFLKGAPKATCIHCGLALDGPAPLIVTS